VKGRCRRTEEDVLEKPKEARAALDEMIECGKHVLAEKAGNVEVAIKAGRRDHEGEKGDVM
jgi:hypothetical protein